MQPKFAIEIASGAILRTDLVIVVQYFKNYTEEVLRTFLNGHTRFLKVLHSLLMFETNGYFLVKNVGGTTI